MVVIGPRASSICTVGASCLHNKLAGSASLLLSLRMAIRQWRAPKISGSDKVTTTATARATARYCCLHELFRLSLL